MAGLVLTSSGEARPDHCHLFELAYIISYISWAEHSRLWLMSLDTFDKLFYHLRCLFTDFNDVSAFVGC